MDIVPAIVQGSTFPYLSPIAMMHIKVQNHDLHTRQPSGSPSGACTSPPISGPGATV